MVEVLVVLDHKSELRPRHQGGREGVGVCLAVELRQLTVAAAHKVAQSSREDSALLGSRCLPYLLEKAISSRAAGGDEKGCGDGKNRNHRFVLRFSERLFLGWKLHTLPYTYIEMNK